jgi:hypothetical protein
MGYFGNWSSQEDMAKDFSNDYGEPLYKAMLADVIFAAYEAGGYEGEALVLFRDGAKLYEVNASHCSCYGLEGQWKPEEIEPEVLLERIRRSDYGVAHSFRAEIEQALEPNRHS